MECHNVVWGPSAKLLTEDQELQEYAAKIKQAGVDFWQRCLNFKEFGKAGTWQHNVNISVGEGV